MKIYKTDKETGNLLLVTPQEFLSDKDWKNNGLLTVADFL